MNRLDVLMRLVALLLPLVALPPIAPGFLMMRHQRNHCLPYRKTATELRALSAYKGGSRFLQNHTQGDDNGNILAGFLSSPERYAAALNMTTEEVSATKAVYEQAQEDLHLKLQSTDLSGTEKHTLICENRLKYGRHPFTCLKCWSYTPVCLCHLVDDNKLQLPDGIDKVLVWTHHREWGLTSNTGCLLPLALQNTAMLMKGLPHHDQLVEDALSLEGNCLVVVLWPAEDGDDDKDSSISSSSTKKREPARTLTLKEVKSEIKTRQRKLILIAIDGTWRNARRMVSKIPPSIPRLDLPMDVVFSDESDDMTSILAPLRSKGPTKSEVSDRQVCTAEAVVNALIHLGLSRRDGDRILEITRRKVDLIRRYRGKDLR